MWEHYGVTSPPLGSFPVNPMHMSPLVLLVVCRLGRTGEHLRQACGQSILRVFAIFRPRNACFPHIHIIAMDLPISKT